MLHFKYYVLSSWLFFCLGSAVILPSRHKSGKLCPELNDTKSAFRGTQTRAREPNWSLAELERGFWFCSFFSPAHPLDTWINPSTHHGSAKCFLSCPLIACAHCVSTFRLKMTTFLCKEQQSLQPLAPAVLGQGFGLDGGSSRGSQAPDLSAL